MNNEETVISTPRSNNEETVVNTPHSSNEETIVAGKNQPQKQTAKENKPQQPTVDTNEGWSKKKKQNGSKQSAAVTAGIGVAAAIGGIAGAAGMHALRDNGEDPEDVSPEDAAEADSVEEVIAEPVAAASNEHTEQSHHQSHASSDYEPKVESDIDVSDIEAESYDDIALNIVGEEIDEPGLADIEPEVEIVGLEVVPTDQGDLTVGSVEIGGEEYMLVDVDGGDFDVAWHDDNNDQMIQENELFDISDVQISVDEFAQMTDDTDYETNESEMAQNDTDIDYYDASGTSDFDFTI